MRRSERHRYLPSPSCEETLQQLVLGELVASNCETPDLTKGDAALLAGTAQSIAEHMGVSTEQYFSAYVHPAMAVLANSDGCSRHAATTRKILEKIRGRAGVALDE